MSLAPPDDGPCNRRTKPRWPDQRDPRWRIRRRPRSWRARVEFRERELRAGDEDHARFKDAGRSDQADGPGPDESLERGGVRFVATETIAEASITECHARSSHQSLVAAGIERPGMSMRRSVRSDLMDGGGFAHSLAASEFVGKATFVGLDVEGQAGRIVYFCDAFYPHRCWARKIM